MTPARDSSALRLKVLIVEDEVLVANELEYAVQQSGGEPIGLAMTSAEAAALAAQVRPDLALVDVHLSDGPTGIDTARSLAADCGAVVLFLTANLKRLPEDYAGACGVMSKPCTEHGVRRALIFLMECVREGRALRPVPSGLILSPAYVERWAVCTA